MTDNLGLCLTPLCRLQELAFVQRAWRPALNTDSGSFHRCAASSAGAFRPQQYWGLAHGRPAHLLHPEPTSAVALWPPPYQPALWQPPRLCHQLSQLPRQARLLEHLQSSAVAACVSLAGRWSGACYSLGFQALLISRLGAELSGRGPSPRARWLWAPVFPVCGWRGRRGRESRPKLPPGAKGCCPRELNPFFTTHGEVECCSSATWRLFTRAQVQAFKAFFLALVFV